jgi:hypothetical protein
MATILSHELAAIERAREVLDLTYDEIATALKADDSTLHRWRKGDTEPSPIFLSRLDSLGEFLAELQRTVKDPLTARYWLDRPVPALHNQTPRTVLLEGKIDRLTALLSNFNAGNAL